VAILAVRDLTRKKTIGWLIIIIFGLLAGIYGERALISLLSHDWYAFIISAVVILISVRVMMLGGKLARES